MAVVDRLFATAVYRAEILDSGSTALNRHIAAACRSIARDDAAGRAWSRRNGYPGYTSYASLSDLPWRVPAFAELAKMIDRHVVAFAGELDFDLKGRLKL